jgi:hypothetical protein
VAARIAGRRDIGTALFAPRDTAPPQLRLLGSVDAAALRDDVRCTAPRQHRSRLRLVGVAFTWELVGALVGAPPWALDISPFEHIGLVPIQPYPATAAAVMVALATAAATAGALRFARRDL